MHLNLFVFNIKLLEFTISRELCLRLLIEIAPRIIMAGFYDFMSNNGTDNNIIYYAFYCWFNNMK